jgi:putative NADH-flavin reductase
MTLEDNQLATVLIIGASKGIGRETVKAALAAGHTVKAFARSAASIPITDARLEKVSGDALNRADVEAALSGTDAVVQSLGISNMSELMTGTTLFSNTARILVDAMQARGPKRLIMVTGAGAGDSRGKLGFLYDKILFPLTLGRVYADKDIAEDMVRKSSLEWTIARPGGLTNGPKSSSYKVLVESRDWHLGFISRASVADFLVRQIDDRNLIGKTPVLVG